MNDFLSKSGKLIPQPSSIITGSEFISNNLNNSISDREKNILQAFLDGQIPNFLRNFAPVEVTDGKNKITYLTFKDFLSIGTDEDYVRMPMSAKTAQTIADQYDCTLITKKMSKDIWESAINQLEPIPWGPPYDASMYSTYRYNEHNNRINNQITKLDLNKFDFVAGHKKDVVISNHLAPNNPNKKVCIYGWFHLNGEPIQGENYFSHELTYQDYAHGIRLVCNDVIVNDEPYKIQEVFIDKNLCNLLNDSGPLKFLRY